MKKLHKKYLPGLAFLLIASSLPVSCQNPTGTGTVAPTVNGAVADKQSALSGLVYSGRNAAGNYLPPTGGKTFKVRVLDGSNEVASGNTDQAGRFYISNIPVPETGKEYEVKIDSVNLAKSRYNFLPGRIVNLSAVEATATGNTEDPQTISGTLLTPQRTPLANVKVRDKTFIFNETTTDAQGKFSLNVAGEEIEVLANPSAPVTIARSDIQGQELIVDPNNVRTVKGVIKDAANSNLPLAGIKVQIQGQNISAISDKSGNYTLNGAPVGAFTLDVVNPDGYTARSFQIPPAAQAGSSFTQNIDLQPVGSILVNFQAENAPSIAEIGCRYGFNCNAFDLNPQDRALTPNEDVYDNSLGTVVDNTATITIEGSTISRQVTYPAALKVTLRGTSVDGDPLELADAVTASNFVIGVLIPDIPGGKQSITISMPGFQTQKSIPVFVPSRDTISTELITLYRVQRASSVGDVQGFIRLKDTSGNALNFNQLPAGTSVRIGYLDVTEAQSYIPRDGEKADPVLIDSIQDAVKNPRSASVDASGKYYLKNVPTGSRISLVAALTDADGNITDCFLPNVSVLLNVRASQINPAPDLDLTRRPDSFCP